MYMTPRDTAISGFDMARRKPLDISRSRAYRGGMMDLTALNVDTSQSVPLETADGGALTLADLERLRAEGPQKETQTPLKRLSERHHALARLLASGTRPGAASIITGINNAYISILQNDPSFKELIEFYRNEVNDEYRGMHAQLAGLGEDALEELRRRVEEEPDKIPFKTLLEVVTNVADRTGHGPSSSSKQEVNVTIGLADRLAAARKAANVAIEAQARDVTPKEPSGE